MPVEPSQSKLKRRSSRKDVEEPLRFDGGHAREIELKRNRGEISCAECRRLKIKCDKQIPCQSCQRRGCAALCPNGSLATGQGTRFVLAATEHLHRRIAKMSERIRQLEDALSALQAKHSNEPHPLLREDLLSANMDGDDDDFVGDDGPAPNNPPDIIDAFGTLSISDHGISRFFGPTGGSESLLMADNNLTQTSPASSRTPESLRDSNSPALPGELTLFSQSFPFTPMGPVYVVQQMIQNHLPPWERASSLAKTYLDQAAWLFHGVSKMQLMDEMLPAIYKREAAHPHEDYSGPHDLALLFIVFAVGALVDLDQEPANAEAEHYHQIARAAVCLQPVLEKPSMVTIQTLHLLSIYNAMSGNEVNGSETSMETTWSLVTLAAHLSQTIGLHRDSARWGLSPKMVQRRRVLFWDLFVADVWQSLNTGRPPSFSLVYIDCRFPQADEDAAMQQGDKAHGYESWASRFASECVADVAARTLTAETPSYATIMELDRKVREFPMLDEETLLDSASGRHVEEPLSIATSLRLCVLSHVKEVVLLYIHRSFFAQAIIDHPANPLRSSYAPSFLAAYRASSTILKTIRDQFAVNPSLCARFWTMWTFAFSAAVVFGTVVTRGPRSPLASAAMTELEHACILFSKASVHSRRAAKALPILGRLSEKARHALAAADSDDSTGSGTNGSQWNVNQDNDDDELAIFAGRTRFVSSARQYAPSPMYSEAEPVLKPTAPSSYIPPQQPDLYRVPSSSSFRTDQTASSSSSISGSWVAEHPSHPSGYNPVHHTQLPPLQYPAASRYQQQHERMPVADPVDYSWNPQYSVGQQYAGHLPPQYNLPPPPPPPHRDSYQHGHHSNFATTPAFHEPQLSQPPPSELTDLGLASRDSRLDERWTSFMADSGLLEDMNSHPR